MATLAGDVVRAAARFVTDVTEETVNVFHFQVLTAGTGGDTGLLAEISAKVGAAYNGIADKMPNNTEPNVIDCYNVSQDYPLGSTLFGGGFGGGTATGDQNAQQVALLLLWKTAHKRTQGRTYIGPIVQAQMADGLWGSGIISAADTFQTNLLASTPVDDDWELKLRVYSRTGGAPYTITSTFVSPNPSALTRRRRGRGS